MKVGNLLTIIIANIRMYGRDTVLPSLVLLLAVPFLYGTANLEARQSADCLERMVSLIGIPMFTALVRREHSRGLYEIVALRAVSLRLVLFLRVVLSIAGTLLLILGFAGYMRICGCVFPFFSYVFRALAGAMALGFTGLLAAVAAKNTASGFAGAFCFYFCLQADWFPELFRPVANGLSFWLVVFLAGTGAAAIWLCEPGSRYSYL